MTVRNANGSTPLHLATDPEIASMLLDAAADPNAVDQVGNSPVGFLCLALQATSYLILQLVNSVARVTKCRSRLNVVDFLVVYHKH